MTAPWGALISFALLAFQLVRDSDRIKTDMGGVLSMNIRDVENLIGIIDQFGSKTLLGKIFSILSSSSVSHPSKHQFHPIAHQEFKEYLVCVYYREHRQSYELLAMLLGIIMFVCSVTLTLSIGKWIKIYVIKQIKPDQIEIPTNYERSSSDDPSRDW